MSISKKLGLYIHVPFCVSKCYYCDFYSLQNQREMIEPYVKATIKHLKEYSIVCSSYTVDTIYFGGGTPSFIGEKNISAILKAITKGFNVDKNAEITVEANPESINKKFLKEIKKRGVTRLSIGIQSSNDYELCTLGRVHTFVDAVEKYQLARDLGFCNISVDLMFGLPNQTLDSVSKSVDDILALSPQHISTYALKLEEGTPLHKDNPSLPDDDTQADMYLLICEKLKNAGYRHYEISNFCKNGSISRHNSKYWNLSEYLGLGPGAHSFMSSKRFEYKRDINAYIKGITDCEESSVSFEENIPGILLYGEYLMLRLRTDEGIDESYFTKTFKKPFEPYEKVLQKYKKLGLATEENGNWHLTEKGFLVSNTIILDVLEAQKDMEE